MTTEASSSRPRRRVPRWAVVLAIVVLVHVVLFLIASALARREEARVERRWAADLVSFEDELARHPDAPTNAAAKRLEDLASTMDLHLAPGTAYVRLPPSISKDLHAFIGTEMASDAGQSCPAPESVVTWLAVQEAPIRAIVGALSDDASATWESAPARGLGSPSPNLGGFRTLQMILSAAALEHARAGRDEEAVRTVDASWALNASLRDRPERYTQAHAGFAMRMQLAVLRKTGRVPMEWDARLVEHDWRASLEDALAQDAWASFDYVHENGCLLQDWSPAPHPRLQRIEAFVLAPPARYLLARANDTVREDILLARRSAPCELVLPERVLVPSWLPDSDLRSVMRERAPERVSKSIQLVTRLAFDIELTRQVLLARRERGDASTLGPCERWTFTRRLGADGRMEVGCVQCPIPLDPPGMSKLPMRWREGPPANGTAP